MIKTDILYDNIIENQNHLRITRDLICFNFHSTNINRSFDAVFVKELLSNFKVIRKCENKKIRIKLDFYGKGFGDESVVIYLEIAMLDLINQGFTNIEYKFHELDRKWVEYPLYYLSRLKKYYVENTGMLDVKKFKRDYEDAILKKERNYKISQNIPKNFLMIVENDGDVTSQSYASSVVMNYLNENRCLGPAFKKKIMKLISEIIDNSLSHSDEDCVVSIKQYDVIDSNDNSKYMLSISIANFSRKKIYSSIKEKLENDTLECAAKDTVKKAYTNHSKKFDEIYDFEFFCMVSAFQKSVTTRENASNNSGRGLTTFIRQVISFAELDSCYAYSGDKLLWFKKDFLSVNDDGLVGFNKSNDYVCDVPDGANLKKMEYNNNGTLFNLKLIYDKGVIYE